MFYRSLSWGVVLLSLFVDDMIINESDHAPITSLKKHFQSQFEIERSWPSALFLGHWGCLFFSGLSTHNRRYHWHFWACSSPWSVSFWFFICIYSHGDEHKSFAGMMVTVYHSPRDTRNLLVLLSIFSLLAISLSCGTYLESVYQCFYINTLCGSSSCTSLSSWNYDLISTLPLRFFSHSSSLLRCWLGRWSWYLSFHYWFLHFLILLYFLA